MVLRPLGDPGFATCGRVLLFLVVLKGVYKEYVLFVVARFLIKS